MARHLDENRSFLSRRRLDSMEGDDLPAYDLVPVPVLLDLRRLWHEMDAAVHALEDEKGPARRLILRSADNASSELHTRDELSEEQRCIGIHQKLAVAREAPPDIPIELDPLKRCAVMFRELEGALSDAPGEAEFGQEPKPPEELEAQLSRTLRARYRRLELDSPLRIRPARERLVQVAIGACLDRALPRGDKVALKPEAKRLGGELLASQAEAVPHVIPGQLELNSLVAPAAEHHVEMRMGGIEVRDSHPLEAKTEIPLHRRHEFACVLAEIESLALLR